MKIIFSRKGYDSKYGGKPSPIFPDNTFCSLPIPMEHQNPKLKDLSFNGRNLGTIVGQLKQNKNVSGSDGVHLDPDLNRDIYPRIAGWHPSFGQVGTAQTHLNKQNVGRGDIFLFFGWFRQVIETNGRFQYNSHAPHIHCMFGWLQVGSVFHPGIDKPEPPKWVSDHPHVKYATSYAGATNTLYVASDRLHIPGLRRNISGGGVFPLFSESLQLTEPGNTRRVWRLPKCFYPQTGAPVLSYHSDLSRWSKDNRGVLLITVDIGQEFVLDCAYNTGVFDWLIQVFKTVPTSKNPQKIESTSI